MERKERWDPLADAYVLPRVASEFARWDIQHDAIRAAMGGNYIAPLTNPRGILDVGAGTGQWAYELCEEFPDAIVVGLDLVPGKPGAPARFVCGRFKRDIVNWRSVRPTETW